MHDYDKPPRTNKLAIASLVLGLSSFLMCVFTGVPAALLGGIAIGRTRRSEGSETGARLAYAGIAISMIGMVVATAALPVLQKVRMDARRTKSLRQIQRIGWGINAHAMKNGVLPPQCLTDESGAPLHSWRTLILPSFGPPPVPINLLRAWDDPANARLADTPLPLFRSAFDDANSDALMTNYVAVVDPQFAIAGPDPVAQDEITDGLHNTVVLVEIGPSKVKWPTPVDLTWDEFLALYEARAVSTMPGGVQALMCDASTRIIPYGLSPEELRSLFTRAGGEPAVDLPDD